MSIPVVRPDDRGIPTLYVNDAPFFCRSGEIHNSSASSLEFLEKEVWPHLRGLNLNSVIAPLYWELIEPVEGSYDFTLLDGMIRQARAEGLRLILLWFGLWKNGESMYVPAWMKRDTSTYYRVRKANGEAINTISPLCKAAVAKDKAAFAAIMRHLREIDGEENTVITIQVENEIGVLGAERDYSAEAEVAFADEVPADVAGLFGVVGCWREAFGAEAEEYFMASAYARAVEEITAAGRAEYPLPCYANAWLEQYPWYKGSYPCGGPVRRVHKIWKALAPSLFALGPDIYVPYCADVMDEYAYEGNPLFIPEIRKDAVAASYCLYAFFAKNAICFSPFGVEELTMDESRIDKPPMEVMIALNIDPSAFDITGSGEKLAAAYRLVENLEPIYLAHRGTPRLKAAVRHGENDFGTFMQFSEFDLSVSWSPRRSGNPLGSLAVFELTPEKFLLVGTESGISFRVKPGENQRVGYIRIEEGEVERGVWKPGRVLNGDEMMAIKFGSMPKAFVVELYKY